MKVLVVEDEDASLRETLIVLSEAAPDGEFRVARDREAAIALIEEEEFDLIICDLKIPFAAGDLDAQEVHGLFVHAFAQEHCPGTPTIFLTGKATPTNVQGQLAHGAVTDYYGLRDTPMVQLAIKDSNRSEVGYIRDMAKGLSSLGLCELVGDDLSDPLLRRAVLSYAQKMGATSAVIEPLPGLSKAVTARATLKLSDGQTRSVFVKLQERSATLDERDRYELNVPNKLRHGYFAPSAAPPMVHGLRKKGALFYTVAANTQTFFAFARERPEEAARIVVDMETDHRAWTDEQQVTRVSVGDLRRARLGDEDERVRPLFETEWREQVESVVVDLSVCASHGDLHGLNILVDDSLRATLIDYGDVNLASSALDPITLELSFLFHEKGPGAGEDRTGTRLTQWGHVDRFARGSSYAPIIRACREWAYRVADPATILATAYVHAVRQLRYPDVDNSVALAVAGSAGLGLLEQL